MRKSFPHSLQKSKIKKNNRVLEAKQDAIWTSPCKQTHEKSIITKGLLTAARFPRPPWLAKISGKSEAGKWSVWSPWEPSPSSARNPNHFPPPGSIRRMRRGARSVLNMTKLKCSNVNRVNCGAAAASNHGQAFSSCPPGPRPSGPESQQDAWHCAHGPTGCAAARARHPEVALGSHRICAQHEEREGGRVHPPRAPLPLLLGVYLWNCSVCLFHILQEKCLSWAGLPSWGLCRCLLCLHASRRHGYISHTNAKPEAC